MGIKSLSNSSGIVNFQKHQSMLAGIELNKFHHLETVRLGSSAASVTFTNLGQYSDFQHLQVRFMASSSTGGNLLFTMNNDTGASYSQHQIYSDGTSIGSNSDASSSSIYTAILDSAISNPGVIDILDAFETGKNKTVRTLTSGDNYILFRSGAYYSTNAVTSLTLTPSGNLLAGSRFSLYGLKARA